MQLPAAQARGREGRPVKWAVHVNLWHIAATNLSRHRRKTIAAFVPLAVVVMIFSALNFVRDGMLRDAMLSADVLPDLTVQGMSGGRPERLSTALVECLARMDNVARVAPRVWGCVPIEIGGERFTYTLTGIDVKTMPKPDDLGLAIERGRFLSNSDTNGAVVGRGVAETLNVGVGDELVLKDDMGNAGRLKVVGLFTSDVHIQTADLIVVPIQAARTFFGYRDDDATDLCVYLTDPAAADAVATGIQASTKGVRVMSKGAIRDVTQQTYGSRAGVFQLMWLILLLTAMLVAWAEASSISLNMNREIGVLKATGWPTMNVIEMKLFENVIVAGIATLGGMLAGLAYVLVGAPGIKGYFLGWAIVYPEMSIPVHVTVATVILILTVGIFPLLVATVIPAWAVGVIDPDEAMRG
jgi:ABC-type lipoprotein release transport system permease subunit